MLDDKGPVPVTVYSLAFAMGASARRALSMGALKLPQQSAIDGLRVDSG